MSSSANSTASPPPAAGAALPALDNTFGAMFLGTVFGQMLYGLTVYQTYKYFRLYAKDTLFHKVLVATILLLETFHSILCIHVCYYYVITNYFNPAALLKDIWSLRLLTVVTGAAIIISQSFYARRVYLIGRGFRFVVVLAIILMLGEAAFTLAATVESFILPTLFDFRKFSWMVSATYGLALGCDVVLTGTLIFVLLHSRTGFKTTDNIIEVLILYMVNTGLLTGIISIIAFVFALTLSGNLIYVGFGIVGAKLYANSLLAVLNSRKSLNNKVMEGFEVGTHALPQYSRSLSSGPRGAAVEQWEIPTRVTMPIRSQIDIRVESQTVHDQDAQRDDMRKGSYDYLKPATAM
ncbi:hypothetical protein ONZ51_g5036 [Trametes cubensis]|uniref:DUF6534 domain-containing protein n=1 Tax=Trametes cubensis TaxID=1111947 RepID=A0AAD7XCE9_9APHY|nr:hypothetical protein ONZ51_g5036 [Trametes cubensis]